MLDHVQNVIEARAPNPRPSTEARRRFVQLVTLQMILLARHDCANPIPRIESKRQLAKRAITFLNSKGFTIEEADFFRQVCGKLLMQLVAYRFAGRAKEADALQRQIETEAGKFFKTYIIELVGGLPPHGDFELFRLIGSSSLPIGAWLRCTIVNEAIAFEYGPQSKHICELIAFGKELFQ